MGGHRTKPQLSFFPQNHFRCAEYIRFNIYNLGSIFLDLQIFRHNVSQISLEFSEVKGTWSNYKSVAYEHSAFVFHHSNGGFMFVFVFLFLFLFVLYLFVVFVCLYCFVVCCVFFFFFAELLFKSKLAYKEKTQRYIKGSSFLFLFFCFCFVLFLFCFVLFCFLETPTS